eukprot:3905063-Alexandrium_andersonii.AAC.1
MAGSSSDDPLGRLRQRKRPVLLRAWNEASQAQHQAARPPRILAGERQEAWAGLASGRDAWPGNQAGRLVRPGGAARLPQ